MFDVIFTSLVANVNSFQCSCAVWCSYQYTAQCRWYMYVHGTWWYIYGVNETH